MTTRTLALKTQQKYSEIKPFFPHTRPSAENIMEGTLKYKVSLSQESYDNKGLNTNHLYHVHPVIENVIEDMHMLTVLLFCSALQTIKSFTHLGLRS